MQPRKFIFEVSPQALDRIQFRTIPRQKHEAHVIRNTHSLRRVTATIIKHNQIERIGIRRRKSIKKNLEVRAIKVRQFKKEVVAGGGSDRAIQVEILEIVLGNADRLHASRAQAPAADRV